jgi:hypothetical protein
LRYDNGKGGDLDEKSNMSYRNFSGTNFEIGEQLAERILTLTNVID